MSENTKIAHHTFKPWEAKKDKFQLTKDSAWRHPIEWNLSSGKLGVRFRVLCDCDVFDSVVPLNFRVELFKLIAVTHNLDWMLLTSNIDNVMKFGRQIAYFLQETRPFDCGGSAHDLAEGMCNAMFINGCPLSNVWLGAIICNQEEADRDIPKLFAVPAAKHFISVEPMLGEIDLSKNAFFTDEKGNIVPYDNRDNTYETLCGALRYGTFSPDLSKSDYVATIDWVICGGETGKNARPVHPFWVRSLRDQCKSACVPFFFKQWGEWGIFDNEVNLGDISGLKAGFFNYTGAWWAGGINPFRLSMIKVGRQRAGRFLDGQEHSEVPQ